MKRCLLWFGAMCLATVGIAGDVPGLIHYQGALVDSDLPANGTFNMTFRIYDHATAPAGTCGVPGNSCQWQEIQPGVAVQQGVFNVLLGSVNPIGPEVLAGPDRWLEVVVQSETMSPRQRIASAAYAIRATRLPLPAIVVAASDSQQQEAADYFADGEDDQVTIQQAIDAVGTAGGEVVLLAGTYSISAPIELRMNVRLVGQGPSTNLVADGDWEITGQDEPMVRSVASNGSGPGAPRTELAYVRLTSNGHAKLFGWHGVNGSYNAWIHHNYFTGFRASTGTVDPSGAYRNIVTNNIFDDCDTGYNGTDSNVQFGNVVASNVFQECGRACVIAAWPYELVISGNSINSTKDGAIGIRIDGSYGDMLAGETERGRISITGNVVRMSGTTASSHALMLSVAGPTERATYGDFEKATISGNYFSSNGADAVIFYSSVNRVLFQGNTVDIENDDGTNQSVSGIRIGASYDVARAATSNGIDIVANNFYGGAGGTALEIDNVGHSGISFRSNHVYGFQLGVDIQTAGAGTAASGTRITDNIFTGVASPVVDNGVQTVIRDNAGFVTESSGTAEITSGDEVVVSHGLHVTPEIRNISVTPTNGMGNASHFWIENVTATTFTIRTNTNPGPQDATFVWQIDSF